MTTARFYLAGDREGPKFARNMKRNADMMRTAMRGAANEAKENIEAQGAADIAGAGNFGTRWTTGFHVDVGEGGGNIRIDAKFNDTEWYWGVFEYGATIQGNPELWIPLSFADVPKGLWARDYPGGLFRVDRKDGAPLLLSIEDKKPKYFGKESVTIPQKFHLREIIRKVASEIKDYFNERFKKD